MKARLHTPWSDVISLIAFESERDAEGYEKLKELPREVMCTFEEGVSQNEFYLSHKEGLRANASVELWAVDYDGEAFADFEGRRFRVLRAFQSSFDCKTLILSEVVR